ncbi:MAG TPA: type II toxin-antitoxin system RelE/ParE family toxin [Chitinophagaceae bacterium]|jgi:plasmid stabilization system protein ParE
MSYKLLIKPGAEEDIDHAYNWYEDQQIGLGETFLDELSTYYKKLQQRPAIFSKLNPYYRQAALKRFPYVIVFEIIKREVIVYAVFHTSRNPQNKLRRK